MVKWRPRETRDNLFKACEAGLPIVVYDLETTGLKSEQDKIIQISGIKVRFDAGTFVELGRFDHYINPCIPIPPKITEITGINDEMVFNQPTEEELFGEIFNFFNDAIVSGYNVAKFDNGFMKALFERNGATFAPDFTVDVIEMAKDNIEKGETENFKLGTIASHYGVDKGLTFHNSMDDVIATKSLLEVFYHSYKETYDDDEGLNAISSGMVAEATGQRTVDTVSNISFWEGFKGFSRIYIVTNLGDFFYDIRNHIWNVSKKNNPYSVDEVDMETLRNAVFAKCGVSNEADFVKAYTPKASKEVIVITNVTSMRYWKKVGDNGKNFERIYISTDVGDFYFDILLKKWVANNNAGKTFDMESLKALCFQKAGVNNEDDFCLYR